MDRCRTHENTTAELNSGDEEMEVVINGARVPCTVDTNGAGDSVHGARSTVFYGTESDWRLVCATCAIEGLLGAIVDSCGTGYSVFTGFHVVGSF